MFSDSPNTISQRNFKSIGKRPSNSRRIGSITEDRWFNEAYDSLPCPINGNKRPKEDYQDAYQFGRLYSQRTNLPYEQAERELETIWNDLIGPVQMDWQEIQPVVQHAYSLER